MKNNSNVYSKIIASTVATTLGVSALVPSASVFASEKQNSIPFITHIETSPEQEKFILQADGHSILFDYITVDENTIELKTVTDGNEVHIARFTEGNDFFYFDDEKVDLNIRVIDENISNENEISLFSYSELYMATYQASFAKNCSSLGAVATLVGGGITAAIRVGIAKSSLSKAISEWASYVGLGSLAGGYLVDGGLTWKLYKTRDKVNVGYGKKDFMYRHKDVGVKFKVKGKNFNKTFYETGHWWTSNRPFSLEQ